MYIGFKLKLGCLKIIENFELFASIGLNSLNEHINVNFGEK